jgi:hypothetical protein
VNGSSDSTTTTAVPHVVAPPATDGTPSGPSLITTDSLGTAIATLRSANLGQISYLRIQSDRLDAQMVKGDKLRQVQVTPDFKLRTLATSTGSGSGDEFGFSVIRPNAPTRLINRAAAKLHHRRSDVNYLVFSRFGDELQWALFFKNGDLATGDVYGRLKRY